MRQAFKVAVGKYRSEVLMLAFVAEILVSPLADGHPLVGGFLALTVMVLIFAGASYMANRRIVRYVAVPVAGVWLVARILEALADPATFMRIWRRSRVSCCLVRCFGRFLTASTGCRRLRAA